jgi:hypothetical protein
MIFSQVFVYSCLFLIIFDFISLVKSREFSCRCCGQKNDHYKSTCRFKDNCPLNNNENISLSGCYSEIERKIFIEGEKIKCSSCAKEGDHRCHIIANRLGGSGNCENCMSCSHKMNHNMRIMEKFVKDSDGGIYIVTCDDRKYAKSITQIFRPYKGDSTTTIIFREKPTNYHDEF